MSIIVNLYYTGENGSARKFAEEMESSGIAEKIRHEPGNRKYRYFMPFDDPETVMLIDEWESQEAIDIHHSSEMMVKLAELREKYDLHMRAERMTGMEENKEDEKFGEKVKERDSNVAVSSVFLQVCFNL